MWIQLSNGLSLNLDHVSKVLLKGFKAGEYDGAYVYLPNEFLELDYDDATTLDCFLSGAESRAQQEMDLMEKKWEKNCQ